jgi:hypothetical protein
MKRYGYLFLVVVLSTVAASDGFAASGPPAHPLPASKADKTAITHPSHAAPGDAPKTGGRSGAVGNGQAQPPGGGKGISAIDGTGIGAQHNASVNGTGVGAQQDSSINGAKMEARH